MTRFQLIFTTILIALGVGGVILFAVSKNSASKGAAPIVMWGTLDQEAMTNFLSKENQANKNTLNVSYVKKDPQTFESDLISALARGSGPDLILLPQDLILKQLDKFYVVPFANYSQRSFMDAFIQEGELYLTKDGVVGLPFTVDPMVMYWNRDIFSNAGVAVPPTSWTQFFDLAPKVTVKDDNGNVTQSLVAFGESANVTHFKDMLALLAMQAGTSIVGTDRQGNLGSVLSARGADGMVPGEEALSYYTEFSNPLKSSYSWNRSLPNDKAAFIGGKLAVYFGYASELQSIRNGNPNLNFDVALMPQTEGKKMTFGNMDAIAILKASRNVAAAYTAAVALTSESLETDWQTISGLPPVRRALLSPLPSDAYNSIFYQSALISNAWLDPNREATIDTMSNLIENVTSGRLRISEAVDRANQEIGALLKSNQ
ncbi:MAG TPA: extracellular solute-binding protein [Candidatus Paceibacterota bacterium]|nr:extracellular solute-binding protein [Candidatus Paceibacterota bacterium]